MLTLSGNAEQLANGSKQVEIIDLEGEANHIAFNSRYLQELMPTLDSDRIHPRDDHSLQPRSLPDGRQRQLHDGHHANVRPVVRHPGK